VRIYLPFAGFLASCLSLELPTTLPSPDAARDTSVEVILDAASDAVSEKDVQDVRDVTEDVVVDVLDVVDVVAVCGTNGRPCCDNDAGPDRCTPGLVCARGLCEPCPAGQTACDNVCVNTDTDVAHCGGCGRRCNGVRATAACTRGVCVLGCDASYGNCNGDGADGCETSLTSGSNCGACNRRCVFVQAVATCTSATCTLMSCNAGFADCDSAVDNGCEIDTRTNRDHCGGCRMACAAGQVCVSGRCSLPCASDLTFCTPACVNTTSDSRNCGACGNGCTGRRVCRDSACVCPTGLSECTTACVDLARDGNNCGTCGTVCAPGLVCSNASGTPTCATTCPAGLTPCATSCLDTDTDNSNCGRCGASCPTVANGSRTCSAGVCGFTCNAGYAPMAGTCVLCGAAGQPVCTRGSACSTGLTACSGFCRDTRSSAMTCGTCDTVCLLDTATPANICTSGSCNPTCATGRANCNGIGSDGCETTLATSALHCGLCGRACVGRTICRSSACARCGTLSDPVCTGTNPCDSSLVACSGTCRTTC
jgi:hypothetical protein